MATPQTPHSACVPSISCQSRGRRGLSRVPGRRGHHKTLMSDEAELPSLALRFDRGHVDAEPLAETHPRAPQPRLIVNLAVAPSSPALQGDYEYSREDEGARVLCTTSSTQLLAAEDKVALSTPEARPLIALGVVLTPRALFSSASKPLVVVPGAPFTAGSHPRFDRCACCF